MSEGTGLPFDESPAVAALRRRQADALVADIRKRLEGEPDSVEFCVWLNDRTYEDTKILCQLVFEENPDLI